MIGLIEQIKDFISSKQEETNLQLAELVVNQEYANCLLELNQTTE